MSICFISSLRQCMCMCMFGGVDWSVISLCSFSSLSDSPMLSKSELRKIHRNCFHNAVTPHPPSARTHSLFSPQRAAISALLFLFHREKEATCVHRLEFHPFLTKRFIVLFALLLFLHPNSSLSSPFLFPHCFVSNIQIQSYLICIRWSYQSN